MNINLLSGISNIFDKICQQQSFNFEIFVKTNVETFHETSLQQILIFYLFFVQKDVVAVFEHEICWIIIPMLICIINMNLRIKFLQSN